MINNIKIYQKITKKALTVLNRFGILLTVIRKERMIKNVSKKNNSKKSKKLLTRINKFDILLNVNRK